MVRIAAVEPDTNGGPVGPGIGPCRFAPRDHAGADDAADENEQRHGQQAAPIVEPRDLAANGSPEDAGAATWSCHQGVHAHGLLQAAATAVRWPPSGELRRATAVREASSMPGSLVRVRIVGRRREDTASIVAAPVHR